MYIEFSLSCQPGIQWSSLSMVFSLWSTSHSTNCMDWIGIGGRIGWAGPWPCHRWRLCRPGLSLLVTKVIHLIVRLGLQAMSLLEGTAFWGHLQWTLKSRHIKSDLGHSIQWSCRQTVDESANLWQRENVHICLIAQGQLSPAQFLNNSDNNVPDKQDDS